MCGPEEGSTTISSGWHVCGTSRRATRNLRAGSDGISRAPGRESRHPLGDYGTDLAPLLSPASGGTTSTGIKQHKQRALAQDDRGRPSRAGHRVKMSCVNVPGGPPARPLHQVAPAARFIRSLRELVCFRVITFLDPRRDARRSRNLEIA